ncbi:MAG: hypothetical protein WC876_06835 [Candidatus Thermoplasmatota archaeon]|jgi:hypothetical protein
MKEALSRVFLDDYPITLMGDEAVPPLSRIVRAGGKHPDRVDVVYLTSPSDLTGHPVGPDELIDRTAEPTRPIYLRTHPRTLRPISTVHPEPSARGLRSDPVSPSIAGNPMPNVDPVIAQLGQAPKGTRPPHEEGVFRSPMSSMPAKAPAALDTNDAAAIARRSPGIEALADAEADAEQRQEDERNQEDALQDEQEALAEADEDAETQL